ncbi:MAG: hypothetical protein PHG65_03095 [Kiritimatiellae bacterium]|nr:hypothetical protein [Kiritimatiellia bacterium]
MTTQMIKSLLSVQGPQSGAGLLQQMHMEPLPLWQTLRAMPDILLRRVGHRYLRLDSAVEGYARLSPSIRREFLTYTVVGTRSQENEIEQNARALENEIRRVSTEKRELAAEVMSAVCARIPAWETLREHLCFIIAGDITYEMAHAVPRPESSTGKIVRGSDLDLIAIADDSVAEDDLKTLDEAIFAKKHYLLMHPAYQEEIDYLVKTFAMIRPQLAFDSFKHMIASKILHEGQWLYGSKVVFQQLKEMVEASGVAEKIRLLEETASRERNDAESALLQVDADCRSGPYCNLFFTREEGDEIY